MNYFECWELRVRDLYLSSGLSPTQYQYTGQYSHTADFGLMYYNARWYDPALGRFAQADSIVPPGVQGLDRYAYVNNNPMRYIDPSGHDPAGNCYDHGYCTREEQLKKNFDNFKKIDTYDKDEMVPISKKIGNRVIADAEITPAEEKLILLPDGSRDQTLMFQMWLTEQEAIYQAKSIFGKDFTDGSPGNAFLHSYWNALMTLRFGDEFAEQFATAHETAAGNDITSQFMDMHNNEIGRNIAKSYVDSYSSTNPAPTELRLSASILDAMNNGYLVVLDANILFYSDRCPVCANIP